MDLFNSSVTGWLLFCVFFGLEASTIEQERSRFRSGSRPSSNEQDSSSQRKPCCLPLRFQAVVVPVTTFSVNNQKVTRVFRDWHAELQVQESVLLAQDGSEIVEYRSISDFNHMIQYIYSKDGCVTQTVDFGMLEPCMPNNSQYLGKTYIGDKTDIDAWYFRRTDKNRNIEMTIAVTSETCIPVMEHITGSLGEAQADTLVLFTNVTETVEGSAFEIPQECFSQAPM